MAVTQTTITATLRRRGVLARGKPKAVADLSIGFRPFKFVLMPALEKAIRNGCSPALLPEIDMG